MSAFDDAINHGWAERVRRRLSRLEPDGNTPALPSVPSPMRLSLTLDLSVPEATELAELLDSHPRFDRIAVGLRRAVVSGENQTMPHQPGEPE